MLAAQIRTGGGDRRDQPAHRFGDPGRFVGGDDAQHRLLDELAAERRVRSIRTADHRHRHQRDRRHPGVDERHPERADAGHPLQVLAADVDVGGEVGGGLDPGVGEHRDHRGVDDVAETGIGEEVELGGEAVGLHDDQAADDDHRQLQAEVGEGEQGQRALPLAPGDVEDVEHADGGDHRRGDPDLPAGSGEVAADRLQVVRDRERRESDDDQVVDQDRPAGDEGDQLVEGVAGEGRGATPLAEHRPALDVGQRRQPEEEPGGEEDQRRQTEALVGDDAECEVDRESNRRVGRREQPRDAEAALEDRLGAGRLLPFSRPLQRLACSASRLPRSFLHPRAEPEAADADREEGDPIRNPSEAGPPPLARVTTRTTSPIATKATEKARTAPR